MQGNVRKCKEMLENAKKCWKMQENVRNARKSKNKLGLSCAKLW
jgi:hypothetical protein